MAQAKQDMGSGSVKKLMLQLMIPAVVAQVVNLLYNIVDRIYIGHIAGIGAAALTGVGLFTPILMLLNAFAMLVGAGGAPRTAIALGQGDKEQAEKIISNSFTMLLLFSVVLTIGFYAGAPMLLRLFGASDATFVYAREYIRLYLLGTVFVMVSVGMNPFINSQGFGNMGMVSVLIGAALNILLDPLFIFGFRMGVKGAALATILSQLCSAVWVMWFLTSKKAVLKLKISCMRLEAARVKRILGLGVSGFIMSFTNSLVQVVCNATLQTYGGDIYVGVMTVLNSVREICTLPVQGFTNGASPVMSFNYGEKAFERVKKAIWFVTAVCVSYTVLIWGALRLAPAFFIRIFNDSPELLEKAVPSLHIYFFGFCFMALQFTGQSVFVALGKSKRATFFSLLRKAFIVAPLTVLLPRVANLGVDGVFWAEPISNLIGGCACFITMLCTILPELRKGAVGKECA